MGNAEIYYYPGSSRALHTIDVGMRLSSIQDWTVGLQATAKSFSGRVSRHIFYQERNVRVTIRMIRSVALSLELEGLETHLKGGGGISLAENSDAVFAGFAEYSPSAGDTTLRVWGNAFSNYGGVSEVTAGSPLVLQGPSPRQRREVHSISARSGLEITLATAIRYDWGGEPWVLVRDRSFWPLLYLQEGQESAELLRPSDDTRLTWDLTLPLVERADAGERIAAFGRDYIWPLEENTGPVLGELPGGSGATLDSALGGFVGS